MPKTFRHYEELKDVLGCTPTVASLLEAVNKYRRAFITVEKMEAGGFTLPLQGDKYEEECRYWIQWLKRQRQSNNKNDGE